MPNMQTDTCELTDSAFHWLRALPKDVRPYETGRRYPHIVNKLTAAWPKRELLEPMFDELFIDQRGDRQGLFPAALSELFRLRNYYHDHCAPAEDPHPYAKSICPWAGERAKHKSSASAPACWPLTISA